jgi:hypothetical chaperone protein
MKERLNVGLDFGTSNSAIATVENNRVKVFETEDGKVTQPSSIFIRIDGYISVGNQAIKDFQNPGQHIGEFHFIPGIKPALSLEHHDGNILRSDKTIVNGKFLTRFFPIEELGANLIIDLKRRAEDSVGVRAEGVVLGRPVYFSENERLDQIAQNRLESAAREAGFQEIQFVLEPVAAALYYEKYFSTGEPQKVFVFDFGGGTLDVSVLNLGGDQTARRGSAPYRFPNMVLGSHGIDLGGTDLDKDIFEALFIRYFGSDVTYGRKGLPIPVHFFQDIVDWHLQEYVNKIEVSNFLREASNDPQCSDKDAIIRLITLIGDQQMYAILRSIEAAKIQLSSNGESRIINNYKNIHINEPLSRRKFQTIIAPRLKSIQECIVECLRRAQISPQEIDVVLKVGGSSSNNFVDEILQRTFPDQIKKVDVFTSVVSGLALAAENLFN